MGVQLLPAPVQVHGEWSTCRIAAAFHRQGFYQSFTSQQNENAWDTRHSTLWGRNLALSSRQLHRRKRHNCAAIAQTDSLEAEGKERLPGRKPRRSGSLRQYGDLAPHATREGPADKLYPLLFSELRHGAAWQALADNDQPRFRHVEQPENERRFSFLAMKRTIRRLRQQDHQWLSSKEGGGSTTPGSFPALVTQQVVASALETVHQPLERPMGKSKASVAPSEATPILFPTNSSQPLPNLLGHESPGVPQPPPRMQASRASEADTLSLSTRGSDWEGSGEGGEQGVGEEEETQPSPRTRLFDAELGWRASASIHAAFPFLERHLAHNHWAVEGHLPSVVHAEVIVRILRKYVDDPPLFHLLRTLLHPGMTLLGPPRETLTGLTHLSPFLLNLYAHEIDQFTCTPPVPSGTAAPPIRDILQESCLRKLSAVGLGGSTERRWEDGPQLLSSSERTGRRQLVSAAAYARWGHIWLAAFPSGEAAEDYLRQCRRFVALRLRGSPVSGSPGPQKFLSERSAHFLGIRVKCKPESVRVKVKAKTWLPVVDIVRHWKVTSRVPVPRVAKELQLEGFTDERMSPVGKGEWTTAPDAIIVDRYHRLWSTIIAHYNGCANRREIGNLFQLLRRSCAKTLARKHKNGLMWVRARYGNDLRVRAGPDGPGAAFATPRSQRALTKAWQLQLARPDSFAISTWCVERMAAESRASRDKINRRFRRGGMRRTMDPAELSLSSSVEDGEF